MKTEIYYFSGTGNSLHVARELQKRLAGAALVPVIGALKKNTIKTNAESVGFIFPNFCLSMPMPIYDLLKSADLSSAQYLFALCTRGGTQNEAFYSINKLLKKQDKHIQAQMTINMPWNIPIGKEDLPNSVNEEKIKQLEEKLQKKLDYFSKMILAKRDYQEEDLEVVMPVPSWIKMLNRLMPNFFHQSHFYFYRKIIHFYSNEKCNACGICAVICPQSKIDLVHQKPVWSKDIDCLGCFACINYCPQKAIQVKSQFPLRSYTEQTGRYHHPLISYRDIAQQKE